MDVSGESMVMMLKGLIDKTGLPMAAFARYFGIPYRTLQNWVSEKSIKRVCPVYVLGMIEKILELECYHINEDGAISGDAKSVFELREKTGMSRSDFSRYFDIPYRTVENWESDKSIKRVCPLYVLHMMERILYLKGLI